MLRKTTVYLDAADLRRLKTLAREQGRSTAELIREAVAEYARRRGEAARPRSLGAGHSRDGRLSQRAEALLRCMDGREA